MAGPWREVTTIAVPVSLEMVFQLLLNFGVQVIVGVLGTLALAAVGFVNSLVLVLIVGLSTFGTAAAILAARAYGAGDGTAVARVSTTAGILAFVFTTLAALPAVLAARPILAALGATPDVAAAGAPYFQILAASMPFVVHGAVTSSVFRALGRARTPMTVSMIAVGLNGVLAYALTVGPGPLPAFGLPGAAVASLTAMTFKAVVLAWLLHGRPRGVPFSLPRTLSTWQDTGRRLLTLAFPLALTQVSWSGGAFLYALLFGRLGTEALAASHIVHALEAVFIVGSVGLAAAATTLIGHAVGRGEPQRAQAWSGQLQRAGIVTGLGFGGLYLGSVVLLPHLYPNVSEATLQLAFWGVVINAAFQVVKVRNMILGGGVLPSGGDTRGVVIGDLIGPFVVGLPLAYLLGFTLDMGAWGVFWARIADEAVKAAFFTWRVRRVRWNALITPAPAAVTGQPAT